MALTLAMPLAPSLSVICNGPNPSFSSKCLSFSVSTPPKVTLHLCFLLRFLHFTFNSFYSLLPWKLALLLSLSFDFFLFRLGEFKLLRIDTQIV